MKDRLRGYVGIVGSGLRFISSASGLVVVVSGFDTGDNRFKSVRVGGGTPEICDDAPSVMISILIGRPSK
jgi:hypothetical protein